MKRQWNNIITVYYAIIRNVRWFPKTRYMVKEKKLGWNMAGKKILNPADLTSFQQLVNSFDFSLMMREIKLKLTLAGLVTFQFGIQLMISVCFQFIQPIHRAKTILAEMNSNWNINDAEWNYSATFIVIHLGVSTVIIFLKFIL